MVIIPLTLYLVVGVISAIMSFKCLTARRLLGFQENAAGVRWDDVAPSLRQLLLAQLRLAGMGFLCAALLLLTWPLCLLESDTLLRYVAPCVALVFCTGLLVVNRRLHRTTGASTPWKGSLYAVIMLVTGIVFSALP